MNHVVVAAVRRAFRSRATPQAPLLIHGINFDHLLKTSRSEGFGGLRDNATSVRLRQGIRAAKRRLSQQDRTVRVLQRQSLAAHRVIEEPLRALQWHVGIHFPMTATEVFMALQEEQQKRNSSTTKKAFRKSKTIASSHSTYEDESLEDDLILPLIEPSSSSSSSSRKSRRRRQAAELNDRPVATATVTLEELRRELRRVVAAADSWESLSAEGRRLCRHAAQRNRIMLETLREEVANGTLPMQLEQLQSFAEERGVRFAV